MTGALIGAIIGAFFGAIAAELLDLSAWLSPKIIRYAAKRLPQEDLTARYEEEWLAELASYDGLKLIKLFKAISILWGSRQVATVYQEDGTVSAWEYAKRARVALARAAAVAWRGKKMTRFPAAFYFSMYLGLILLGDKFEVGDVNRGSTGVSITFTGTASATRAALALDSVVTRSAALFVAVHSYRSGRGLRKALADLRGVSTKRTITAVDR